MIDALLLSAGAGTRAGQSKGLLKNPKGQKLLLELQRDLLIQSGVRRLGIVLGYEFDSYLAAMPWLNDTAPSGAIFKVRNERPELGFFSSLLKGFNAWLMHPDPAPWLLLLPVDVPALSPGDLDRLKSHLNASLYDAVLPMCAGKGGHPPCLRRKFVEALLRFEGTLEVPEARLDAQIKRIPSHRVKKVELGSDRILINANSPEDLEHLWSVVNG